MQVSVNNKFVERENKISPTNKVVSKQLSLENSMESSVHSSSNNAQCEEDVSSSHIDTDKPLMSINPSLTQSVAGISRDVPKKGATGPQVPRVDHISPKTTKKASELNQTGKSSTH